MSDCEKTKEQLIEELQRLRQQVAELRGQEGEHRWAEGLPGESEHRFRTILDSVQAGIIIIDAETRRIIDVNPAALEMIGVARDEVVNSVCHRYICPAEQGLCPVCDLKQGVDNSERVLLTNSGQKLSIMKTVTPVMLSGRECLVESFIDITERKRVEADLERRNTQLQTAAQVSRAATGTLDPNELIQKAVDLACQRFELYYVGLFLVDHTGEWVDEAGKWAVLRSGSGSAGQHMLAQGHKLEIGGESMIGWATANRQARIALDVGEEAVRFDNPFLPATRSEMALPLIARGRVIGAMSVQSEKEAAFSEEDIGVLQTMADQLANAIDNARLFNETQKWLREQAMFFNISQQLADAPLQPEQIAAVITRRFVEVMNVPECSVSLLGPDGNTLRILADFHREGREIIQEDSVNRFRLTDYPVTARVMETLQPVVLQASDPDADPAELAYMQEYETTTLAIIPLATKGRSIGVIELEAWDYEHHFTPQELNVAMTLANVAAVALENARLLDEQRQARASLRERVKALACLNDIGQKIDQTPPIPEFLRWVTERIPLATRHSDLCVAAIKHQGQVYGMAEAMELPCQMVQSLQVGGDVVGRIHIAYREERDFLDEDSALLGDIVRRVSGYIENQRLLEQTRAALAEVEATHRSYLGRRWEDYLDQREALRESSFVYDQAQVTAESSLWRPEMDFALVEGQLVSAEPNGDGEPRTGLAMPIILRGQTIGVLGLEDPEGIRQWSMEDQILLESISQQLALTLENARLLEETQHRASRERLARKITDKMRRAPDMDALIQTTVREAAAALGAPDAFLQLSVGVMPALDNDYETRPLSEQD
jgi:PAS domain S-box-containing protein